MADEKLNTKWISPEITCSYPSLAMPASEQFGGKYSLSIPLPKTEQQYVTKLKEVMVNAAVNRWGEKVRDMRGIKTFLEDCDDDPKYDGDHIYTGCLKFNAKAKNQPGMVYPDAKTQVEKERIEEVFYPGCIIRVSVSAYATETGGSRTVAFGLNNVMFVRDGERIGGSTKPSDDFASFADESFINDPFKDSQEKTSGNLF